MRVLVLATILTALAADARPLKRGRCKPKHNTTLDTTPTGGNLVVDHGSTPTGTPVTPTGTPATTQPPTEKPTEKATETPTGTDKGTETPTGTETETPTPTDTEPATTEPATEPATTQPPTEPPTTQAPTETPTETPTTTAPPESTPTPTDDGRIRLSLEDPASTGSEADHASILELHNQLRAQYGAAPLTWDQGLADSAAGFASQCTFTRATDVANGQTIAAGPSDSYTWSFGDLFNEAWAKQASDYNWDAPGASGTDGKDAGYFAQVVWKATTSVGCGWKMCGNIPGGESKNVLFTCEYAPGSAAGDDAEAYRANVGTKA